MKEARRLETARAELKDGVGSRALAGSLDLAAGRLGRRGTARKTTPVPLISIAYLSILAQLDHLRGFSQKGALSRRSEQLEEPYRNRSVRIPDSARLSAAS